MADLRQIVDEQYEDVGLWFAAQTASEAYLQQELRRLHAAIEAAPPCCHKHIGGDTPAVRPAPQAEEA